MGDRISTIVTFKATRAVVKRLDRLAERLGTTRSALVREAVLHYLSMMGGNDCDSDDCSVMLVSVKLPRAIVEELDRLARRQHLSRSTMIKLAVEEYLRRLKGRGG